MADTPQVVPLHQPSTRRAPRRRREPLWRHVVGEVLRLERQRQGRTLRDVCDEAQVSMAYLSEIERGRKEASSEILAATAHALGLTLADVVQRAHEQLARGEAAGQPRTVTPTGRTLDLTGRHTLHATRSGAGAEAPQARVSLAA